MESIANEHNKMFKTRYFQSLISFNLRYKKINEDFFSELYLFLLNVMWED